MDLRTKRFPESLLDLLKLDSHGLREIQVLQNLSQFGLEHGYLISIKIDCEIQAESQISTSS